MSKWSESISEDQWHLVPHHMRDGLILYVENGILPGSFMEAILENDLKGACARADIINRYRIFDIVSFCYGNLPSASWGHPQIVQNWVKHNGLHGPRITE